MIWRQIPRKLTQRLWHLLVIQAHQRGRNKHFKDVAILVYWVISKKNNNAVPTPSPEAPSWSLGVGWPWELSLVIPKRMVPLLQSSTFLYRRKLVLLTRLYNCVYVQRHQISWFPSVDRESLWLSYVPQWWSVQALYLCFTWLLQHKVTKRNQPEHLLQAWVGVGLYLELGHVASPSPWGIACAQQLPRETSCLGRWQLRSH